MRPITAMQVQRAKLEVPTSRPLLEPLLEHDRFHDLTAIYWLVDDEDERLKRAAYRDLGEMLRHTERLLGGEFLDEPIHSADMHARHVQVIVLAISSLLHPKKMRNPPKGVHASTTTWPEGESRGGSGRRPSLGCSSTIRRWRPRPSSAGPVLGLHTRPPTATGGS
jgi:hypothetical protein